jgi:MFS family permease
MTIAGAKPMAVATVERERTAQLSPPNNGRWHALAATFLGECFDAVDASIYFIALYPALSELLNTRDATAIGWYGAVILAVFMFGWSAGSIAFGFLSDRLGRSTTLAVSIIVYALATGMCATSHSWQELALWRFLVGMGIGGEIAVGTVVMGEFWTGAAQPWAMACMMTSFSFGRIIAGCLNISSGALGWRFLFLMGVLPAVAGFYVMAKMPESERFKDTQRKKKELNLELSVDQRKALTSEEKLLLAHPLKLAFSPKHRQDTIVLTLVLSSAIVGQWAGVSWISAWINQLIGGAAVAERSAAAICMGIGGVLGVLLTPALIKWLGFRKTFLIGFVISLAPAAAMFLLVKSYTPMVNLWSYAIGVGSAIPFLVAAIYTITAFPTVLLGTASGVAWGVGRAFAGIIGLCTGPIIAYFNGSYGLAAATVMSVYILGLAASFFVQEYQNGHAEI